MTKRVTRKPAKRRPAPRKLKLSKETLKDLDASGESRVKGGANFISLGNGRCSF